jgi:IS5 family transposase
MSPTSHPSDDQLDAATWCRHLVPQGSVHAFLADHRQQLFPPELFADLTRHGGGHPSVPAEVIAAVMVLQALEGLSDREAVGALRRDIAWKVACGLRLDDEGFHPTVLVYWRNRIRASARPLRILEAVRQVVAHTGVLKGRGRRVLDSTILADAVATQDTVTQLVAAIRRVRRLVATAREVELTAHDYDRAGKPVCAWDDPQATQALVSGLVNDALALLAVVAEVELAAEQAEAVALLALVAGQDVEPGPRPGSWRIARKVAPDRVISTVDPQARHTRKTNADKRDGYKAHIAVEPETGLVTVCALTAANAPDGPTGVELLADEPPGLEVLGDTHYGSGETRAWLRAPATPRRSSRSRCTVRCLVGLPSMTSASTARPAWRAARWAPRRRSAAPARPASPGTARAARCGGAAPLPSAVASSTCTPMRTSCAPPGAAR